MAAYTWSSAIENPRVQTAHGIGSDVCLADGDYLLNYKQVPISWFSGNNLQNLQWDGEKIHLPQDLNAKLFGSIRGEDQPMFSNAVKRSTNHLPPRRLTKGTLVFHKAGTQSQYGIPKNDPLARIRFSIQLFSQLPSIILEFKYKPTAESAAVYYRVVFFGNKSLDNVTYHNTRSVQAGELPCQLPEAHKESANGLLVALTLHFGSSSWSERHLNSIVVLHGESRDDGADRWPNDEAMIVTFNSPSATPFERDLGRLFKTKDVSITFFRESNETEKPNLDAWDPQHRLWEYNMKLSCLHGPFWFYMMQPEFDVDTPGAHLPIPFWLVKTFRAHVSQGQLDRVEPMEWGPFIDDQARTSATDSILRHPNLAPLMEALKAAKEKATQRGAGIIDDGSSRVWRPMSQLHVEDYSAPAAAATSPVQPSSAAAASTMQLLPAAGPSTAQRSQVVCNKCFFAGHYNCFQNMQPLETNLRRAIYEEFGPLNLRRE